MHVPSPELPIKIVIVQVQSLALLGAKPKAASVVPPDSETHAQLHRPQDAHQPLRDPIACDDPLGLGMLILATAGQILTWTARLLGHLLGVIGRTPGQNRRRLSEVLAWYGNGSETEILGGLLTRGVVQNRRLGPLRVLTRTTSWHRTYDAHLDDRRQRDKDQDSGKRSRNKPHALCRNQREQHRSGHENRPAAPPD